MIVTWVGRSWRFFCVAPEGLEIEGGGGGVFG